MGVVSWMVGAADGFLADAAESQFGAVASNTGTIVLLMVTLLPNENYLDSLPIKMFEYMSAAMPVIASDFEDWRLIVLK